MTDPTPHVPKVHDWFGLTYASYLTLPRVILQSMPGEWQERFVACLNELNEEFDPMALPDVDYTVMVRHPTTGRFVEHPYGSYRYPDRALIDSWRRKR